MSGAAGIEIVGPEAEHLLDWLALTDALTAGHTLPRAEIADTFLYRGEDTLLSRSAWISGLGMAVKTATIFPGNARAGLPAVNGGVSLYSDADGRLEALVDFHLVTRWKTAGDKSYSALSASNSRPSARISATPLVPMMVLPPPSAISASAPAAAAASAAATMRLRGECWPISA